MTVGAPQDKNAIDARAYGLAIQVRDVLSQISNFKAFIDSKTSAELQALGYSVAEVSLLQAAVTDLDALRKVATAQQTQPAVNNFLFNSNKLIGPN